MIWQNPLLLRNAADEQIDVLWYDTDNIVTSSEVTKRILVDRTLLTESAAAKGFCC